MPKIKTTVEGFLKDIRYTAHLPVALKPYEDKFGDAESIEVSLSETPYPMFRHPTVKSIMFSDDGKKVRIDFTASKSYNKKGKANSTPSQQEIFESLKYLIERAVEEYAEKFKK